MKNLLLIFTLLLTIISCECASDCEPQYFRYAPGDMPTHKMHGKKIIILDTIRSYDGCTLQYKVKGKDLNTYVISVHEVD